MGTATLRHDPTTDKYWIELKLDSNDRAHVAVMFRDDPAAPKGKWVELSDGGNAAIGGWINATPAAGSNDRQLNSGIGENTIYPPNGSHGKYDITVHKAPNLTNDHGQFSIFVPDPENTVVDHWHDSAFAVDNSTQGLHTRFWTFTDGKNQVIVTIVIQDDEGGGSDDLIARLLSGDKGWTLHVDVNGRKALLSVTEFTLSPILK